MSMIPALAPYTGRAIADRLTGARREAFLANWAQMSANYGENVDAALLDHQILICPETEGALYSTYPTTTRYAAGTRPELEAVVGELTQGADDDLDCAVRLLAFCRDLYLKSEGRLLFYGGTEEELIKKGENLCECLARLMTALCEVKGLPARIITHVAGGHLTNEVFLNGHWGYMDPRTGVFFLKPDGTPASVAELVRDPSLMDDQPDWVAACASARWPRALRLRHCREHFFHPSEVNTVKPYSLADAPNYRYGWTTNRDLALNGMNRINPEYARACTSAFGDPFAPAAPRMLLTLTPGQLLTAPIPVFAVNADTCVPSRRVRFLLDGTVVWETPPLVPLPSMHIAIDGAHPLYGERGLLDPSAMSEGTHTLIAEDMDDPSIRGEVAFIVP